MALIWIVDDDPLCRQMLTFRVKKISSTIEIETYVDGLDAYTHFIVAKRKPDLIISDFEMPNLNGFELCNKLNLLASVNSIKMVVRSSLNEEKLTSLRRFPFVQGVFNKISNEDFNLLKHFILTQLIPSENMAPAFIQQMPVP